MLTSLASQKTHTALLLAGTLFSHVAVAEPQESSVDSSPITCADGLYLIYTGHTYPCDDHDFRKRRTATDPETWHQLWNEYVGVLEPPPVDFERYVVISIVTGYLQNRTPKTALRSTAIRTDGTLVVSFYAEGVRMTGPPFDTEPIIWLNTVWFMAIPRSRLPGNVAPRKVVRQSPWLGSGDYPRDFDPQKTRPAEEQCYLPRLTSEQFRAQIVETGQLDYGRDRTHWEGMVSLFGGVGSAETAMAGPELTLGASRTLQLGSDDWEKWLGNSWGLELSGWIGLSTAREQFSTIVGVRPWVARTEEWGTEWLATKRHPTALGSILPEVGILSREGDPIRPYLAWSAPFLWHREQFYYRTTPYLLREHSALQVSPGVLWEMKTRSSSELFVTLNVGYRLW